MKVYQTGGYPENQIREMRAARTTPSSIFYTQRGRERRVGRRSNYTNYFDTFEEARSFLISKYTHKVDSYKKQLESAIEGLKKVQDQTAPDAVISPFKNAEGYI